VVQKEVSLSDVDAERLRQQHLQQEEELKSLDAKIAAMDAKLEGLIEEEKVVAKPPMISVTKDGGDSSTEGEEDSEDKETRKRANSKLEKESALEQLRKWKVEESDAARKEAEANAVSGMQKVVAGEASTLEEPAVVTKRTKKGGRRRKKKASRIQKQSSGGVGEDEDEDDSGISDSPDPSEDEEIVAVSPITPTIPKKTDLVVSKSRKKLNRKNRAGSHRVAVVEMELNDVLSESASIKKLNAESSEVVVGGSAAGVDVNSKWYVSPMKQEEIRRMAGSNAAFVQGVARIQALVRGKNARRKKKLLQKRVFIAREVVESEKTYVRNLGLCIEHFQEPMSKLSYISDLQMRQMFSEISVIRGFNAHLCGQLQDRHANWQGSGQRLGDIFLSFVAYFRTYTAYVNNYNDAMALFYEFQKKNKSFQSFLAEKKVDPALNGQELPAFLIMPIQRLPRYVMLLEDLLRNTPKDHADYDDLATALAKVQEVADYVNEKKREAENVNQVLDVQARLTGMNKSLAEPHRRFVRQGSVMNMDAKGETMLFLFNDILVTAKETHGFGKLAEKGKEMLGFRKGSSTPKMGRKAAHSPFFGKKKGPQLQAAEDDREYKYLKTISLGDTKISASFGSPSGLDTESEWQLIIKTPLNLMHYGCVSDDELDSWVHDLDAAAMRLVERKRIRCERTAKHHDGADSFLVPTAGRLVVNKADASYHGKVQVRVGNSNEFEWKYVCLLKPHLYVFNDAEDEEPQGWLYLLTSHVVLGHEQGFPAGWSLDLHVPYTETSSASPWMLKHATRVNGHAGNPDQVSRADKDVISEEDQDRWVYNFVGPNVNEMLNWCREIRNVILDSVKLPDDLCPLEVMQKAPDEDNNSCADCGFSPTKYASVNLGVFLCAACAELHRELLEGVSVIRDVKEVWDITPQQRFELEALMGNNKRNKIFEKNGAKKDVPKAKSNDSRDTKARWIKAKYVVGTGKDDLGATLGSSTSSRRMSLVANKKE
jgi:hypothetical protein